MITTNDESLYKSLLRLRSHGINKLDDSFLNLKQSKTDNKLNPWYYEMQELGYNYRITDIQCALGRSQLKKLDLFIKKRKFLVDRYDKAFSKANYIKPIQINYREISSHHLYVVRIDFDSINISRAQLMNLLKKSGIFTQVHYIPVTSHPFYSSMGYSTENHKISSKFYDQALSLPLFYSLTLAEQDKVIKIIKKYVD